VGVRKVLGPKSDFGYTPFIPGSPYLFRENHGHISFFGDHRGDAHDDYVSELMLLKGLEHVLQSVEHEFDPSGGD